MFITIIFLLNKDLNKTSRKILKDGIEIVKVKCSCNSKNISKYVKLLKYNFENEDFLLMLHNELNGLKKLFWVYIYNSEKIS